MRVAWRFVYNVTVKPITKPLRRAVSMIVPMRIGRNVDPTAVLVRLLNGSEDVKLANMAFAATQPNLQFILTHASTSPPRGIRARTISHLG